MVHTTFLNQKKNEQDTCGGQRARSLRESLEEASDGWERFKKRIRGTSCGRRVEVRIRSDDDEVFFFLYFLCNVPAELTRAMTSQQSVRAHMGQWAGVVIKIKLSRF